jgi:thioredoxin reductase
MSERRDVIIIIIGSGPAGHTTAVYAACASLPPGLRGLGQRRITE